VIWRSENSRIDSSSATFVSEFPAIQAVLKLVIANGKSAVASKVGEMRCKRGVFHADCRSDPQPLTGDKAVGGEDVRCAAARASSDVVICPSRHGNGVMGKALISVTSYTAAWSPFVIAAFPSASPTKMARYKSSP
jgi:hypothetical protein